METINQQSFDQVAFAETLHRGVKRLLKAIRAEYSLTQKLEEAKKEKEIASEFIGTKITALSDGELQILARNYPDIEKFIGIILEGRKETVSENSEATQ
jgi:hypothetical protein